MQDVNVFTQPLTFCSLPAGNAFSMTFEAASATQSQMTSVYTSKYKYIYRQYVNMLSNIGRRVNKKCAHLYVKKHMYIKCLL